MSVEDIIIRREKHINLLSNYFTLKARKITMTLRQQPNYEKETDIVLPYNYFTFSQWLISILSYLIEDTGLLFDRTILDF